MATTTKSLSPFDIKGKGWTKIFSFLERHSVVHTPPEYLLKSLNELPLCICHGAPICPCFFWEHAEISALAKLCCSCSPWLKARSATDVLQEEPRLIHHKRLSYHQKTQYIHPSPNLVGIYQYWLIHPTMWRYIKSLHEHYIIHPRHSGETNIGCYMTLIIKYMTKIFQHSSYDQKRFHQMTTIDRDTQLHHESWDQTSK